MKSRTEIAEELYNLNRGISLIWIGLNRTPTTEGIEKLNERLGEIIKELREGE